VFARPHRIETRLFRRQRDIEQTVHRVPLVRQSEAKARSGAQAVEIWDPDSLEQH
jgi:hypothetical protein